MEKAIIKTQLNHFQRTSKKDCVGKLISNANHSLNPNAFMKFFTDNAFLIAIQDIQPNEEICFTYTDYIYPFQEEFHMENKDEIVTNYDQ